MAVPVFAFIKAYQLTAQWFDWFLWLLVVWDDKLWMDSLCHMRS
jgi:hypothetical protein